MNHAKQAFNQHLHFRQANELFEDDFDQRRKLDGVTLPELLIEQRIAAQHVTEPAILAIRTHHLCDDWKQANRWLGQTQTRSPVHVQQHETNRWTSPTRPSRDQGIERQGMGPLVSGIAYFFLIDRAVNLSPSDDAKNTEWHKTTVRICLNHIQCWCNSTNQKASPLYDQRSTFHDQDECVLLQKNCSSSCWRSGLT
eukprot:scaffold38043_cov176-Amphora_coffeaeformis.AAC.3